MSSQPPAQRRASHQVPLPCTGTALAPPSFPSRPGSSILIDCALEGPPAAKNHARHWSDKNKLTNQGRRQVISMEMLPDDVLLEIFHFYVDQAWYEDGGVDRKEVMEAWQALVHVCQRWRSVVFGSPRRLNLRLLCTASTRAGDTVDVWPALPLVIRDHRCRTGSVDNIVALLKRSDLVRRIIRIILSDVPGSQLEDISEVMQVPFPELTHLVLNRSDELDSRPVLPIHSWVHGARRSPSNLYDETKPVLPFPDSFLCGSAPRLRSLNFDGIPYPGLPKLLLSATHLTELHLTSVPQSGYISPEAMVACISTLTSLEWLSLGFRSSQPHPDQESQHPPPLIRTSLPVLDRFWFKGAGEYLEYLMARIDAPRLRRLDITLFNDIVFVTPQLTRFISHIPTLGAIDKASVDLWYNTASIELSSVHAELNLSISCKELDWQLSFLEQVCTSSLPPLSTLEVLYMEGRPWPQDWKDNIDYAQWLELLSSFTAAKNIYLSKGLAPCVVPALQELVGGRTTAVFPTLQNIFLEEIRPGPVQEAIRKLVAARQVTSHPITVFRWDRGSN